MKKIIPLLLIFLFCPSYAISIYKSDIFSKSIFQDNITIDSIRIYIDYGTTLYHNNELDSALYFFNKAFNKSILLGDSLRASISLLRIGLIYDVRKKYIDAIKIYEKALQTLPMFSNKKLISVCQKKLGDDNYYLCKYEDAIINYGKALEIDSALNNKSEIAKCLQSMGNVYYSWCRYQDALNIFEKALRIDSTLDNKSDLASCLNNIGMVYKSLCKYQDALNFFSEALNIDSTINNRSGIASHLNNIGLVYSSWGRYQDALNNYEGALKIDSILNNQSGIATCLNNIGTVYSSWGKYNDAITNYVKALNINRTIDNKSGVALSLINIGLVYSSLGRYNDAMNNFTEALKIDSTINNKSGIASDLSSIGLVYHSLSRYQDALNNFTKALKIDSTLDNESGIASNLNNMGLVYSSWGMYKDAIANYEKALQINTTIGDNYSISSNLSNIGLLYSCLGQDQDALISYKKALQIDTIIGNKEGLAKRMNNIGTVYLSQSKYKDAIIYFEKALQIDTAIGIKKDIATCLNNLGTAYYLTNRYQEAINSFEQALMIDKEIKDISGMQSDLNNLGVLYSSENSFLVAEEMFKESISIIEQIRLTATHDIRRDYFANNTYTYQSLASSYIRSEKPSDALYTIEQSKAKYLVEQLEERIGEKYIQFRNLNNYLNTFDDSTIILCYANINYDTSIVLSVTKRSILGFEIGKKQLLSNIKNYCGQTMTDILNRYRSEQKENRNKRRKDNETLELAFQSNGKQSDFEDVITYYRLLINTLGKADIAKDKRILFAEQFRFIAKELYIYLFDKKEPSIKGKSKLLIIPDGILYLLPFETLVMPDGKYLVEHFDVQYAPSLTTLELIQKRNYRETRKSVIAFGGAVYQTSSYRDDMNIKTVNLDSLRKEAYALLDSNKSLKLIYRDKAEAFDNRPGTLEEVINIKDIFKDALIKSGEEVSEQNIKKLSSEGKLKNYKIVHFATHGYIDQDIPELSAIVLSQSLKDSSEDGFLTMKEVTGLKIEADLVNLSACNTGLGRIYNGEGVVGLMQAFLLAGANGISVTLWSVADKSTMMFMTDLYKLVKANKMTYSQAISTVKRAFINSEQYNSPYYWAPFVYYGK